LPCLLSEVGLAVEQRLSAVVINMTRYAGATNLITGSRLADSLNALPYGQ
jgi:hypothetical protein